METPGTADVVARPPLIYLTSILVGFGLEALWPTGWFPGGLEAPVGVPLVALAVGIFVLAIREFRAAGTPVRSIHPTRTIVRTGPYRFSRNPIYLAFTLLQLGLAVWANSLWLLATLVPTLALISIGVIDREERYLARRFGDGYLDYQRSVRRWL